MISRKAYAKINLSLDVLGKYPNGYHQVKMVMQTVDLYDELSFEEIDSANGDIVLTSDSEGLELDDNNLIVKAAKLLKDRFPSGKGVKVGLVKNIPIAAGMAGGSTDAAATLHGINELFSLGLSDEELCNLGVTIGADIPYCIMGGTMLAEGIGEKLSKIKSVPELKLVIAKPEKGVSTKFVYENLDVLDNPPHPDTDGMIAAIENSDIEKITSKLGNILECVTIPALPEVATIKQILSDNGAKGVLMSGSGPTVFAIFDDDEKADKAAKILKEDSPAKFVCVTRTV